MHAGNKDQNNIFINQLEKSMGIFEMKADN